MPRSRLVLCFQFWNISPHLEASLEIAQTSYEEGADVEYHFLGKSLPYNECFRHYSKDTYINDAIRRLPPGIRVFTSLRCDIISYQIPEGYLTSSQNLKRLKYKGSALGEIVIANLSDRVKSSAPDLIAHREEIQAMISSFLTVYESTALTLAQYSHLSNKEVVIFNSRHINDAAVKTASDHAGVAIRYHERCADVNRYIVLDSPVHDIQQLQREIQGRSLYTKSSKKTKSLHELERKVGISLNDCQHILIKDIHASRLSTYEAPIVITFFASSLDEYSYLVSRNLWPLGAWPDQRAALIDIIHFFKVDVPGFVFNIRIHPTILNKSPDQARQWSALENAYRQDKNINFIWDPCVNSFKLGLESHVCIVYHSSISAELIALGIPVIALSSCLCDYLDSCIGVDSITGFKKAFIDILKNWSYHKSLKARYEATQFFNGLDQLGNDFKHFQPPPQVGWKD